MHAAAITWHIQQAISAGYVLSLAIDSCVNMHTKNRWELCRCTRPQSVIEAGREQIVVLRIAHCLTKTAVGHARIWSLNVFAAASFPFTEFETKSIISKGMMTQIRSTTNVAPGSITVGRHAINDSLAVVA